MTTTRKKNGSLATIEAMPLEISKEYFAEMTRFNEMLNREPAQRWVTVNKQTKLKYIPIRIVETLLRSYFGAYQIIPVSTQLIGNSVVVTVELKVLHPILKQWLTFAGIGAVPIQVQRGANPMEWEKINATAIQRNAPAAKSFAVSNAAKSLGQVFGSNLNGDDDMVIYDVYKASSHE